MIIGTNSTVHRVRKEGREHIITIRPAVKNDCPEIKRLLEGLAEYDKVTDLVKITTKMLTDDGFGESPFYKCIVAELDNPKILSGYVLYYKCYSSLEGRGLHLENIYVEEEYRIFGLGRCLLQSMAKQALEEKFEFIDLNVLAWNGQSIKFYEKVGAKNFTGMTPMYLYNFGLTEMNNLLKQLPAC